MEEPTNTADHAGANEENGAPLTRPGDVLPDNPADAAAVDTFLSGYGRGFQVSIVRTAPVWCAGYLTTLPLDHGITLNEIRESYGGRRFQLRIQTDQGRYVAMRTVLISDVPRDNGKPITNLERSDDAPRPNPAPAPSNELASVLRDLLAAQTAAAERQSQMIERLLSAKPVAQAQAAIANPLEQIQQLGDLIAAVRELSPAATVAEAASGGDGGGEAVMMKLAEKLISKFGSGGGERREAPRRALPPGPPRRPPMIIKAPRPPAIAPAAPPRAPAPAAPHVAIAAAPSSPSAEEIAEAAEPVANPAPVSSDVDFSSTGASELPNEESADEYTADDVAALLEGMPVDDAAEVMRDVFDKLSPEDKERAIAIFMGQDEPNPKDTDADS